MYSNTYRLFKKGTSRFALCLLFWATVPYVSASKHEKKLSAYLSLDATHPRKNKNPMHYYKKGRKIEKKSLQQAHTWYLQGLAACNATTSIATCMLLADALGSIYFSQGAYAEAVNCYTKYTLPIATNANEKTLQLLVKMYHNLAKSYIELKAYPLASASLKKALNIQEQKLAKLEDHRSTAAIYHNYGNYYRGIKNYEKAHEMLDHSLQLKKEKLHLGDSDSEVVSTTLLRGLIHYEQRDYGKSIDCYHTCLIGKTNTLGIDHYSIGILYNNWGLLHYRQGNIGMSIQFYQKALRIQKPILGDKHPNIATIYHNWAVALYHQKNYDQAILYYLKDLAISKPAAHWSVASTYERLSRCYRAKYNDADTIKTLQLALEYYKKRLKKGHRKLKAIMREIYSIQAVAELDTKHAKKGGKPLTVETETKEDQ